MKFDVNVAIVCRLSQEQLELAATASWSSGGEVACQIVALGRNYAGTNVLKVTAAATRALLSSGYDSLRQKGVPAASAAARVESDLRAPCGGSDDAGSIGGNDGVGGGKGLLAQLLDDGELSGQCLLELARDVFVDTADGVDLHHLDLLLRFMLEGAAASAAEGTRVQGDRAEGSASLGKSTVERRLNAHSGLIRRLLKVAPAGLNYKRLIGKDPLADPLADPLSGVGVSGPANSPKRSPAGLAAARARAMAELRSVIELEHVAVLSKLATRIPGLNGSAVYLAAAQRVLCGETGGLSKEALELLVSTDTGSTSGAVSTWGSYERAEEAEAASSSVYHLLAPLLRKMAPEDLVEVVVATCAPIPADDGLRGLPFRKLDEQCDKFVPSVPSPDPFPERMRIMQLTIRCRRKILDECGVAIAEGSRSSGGGGDVSISLAGRSLTAEQYFARVRALLAALDVVSTMAPVLHKLEAAWGILLSCFRIDSSKGAVGVGKDTRKILSKAGMAALEALATMALMGAAPRAVEAACSSMQVALGLGGYSGQEEAANTADGDPSEGSLVIPKVYATATSIVLDRLVRGTAEERAIALGELRTICTAARPVNPEGHSIGSETTATSLTAWRTLSRGLHRFCNQRNVTDVVGVEDGRVAPATILWAQAEVLTVLGSFGELDDAKDTPLSPEACPDVVGKSQGSDTAVRGGIELGEDASRGDGRATGAEGSDPRPVGGLSIQFLRVAELAMEAFAAHISPEDVESWQSRSSLLEKLASSPLFSAATPLVEPDPSSSHHQQPAPQADLQPERQALRLQALADMLILWESEVLTQRSLDAARDTVSASTAVTSSSVTITVVEHVRRMRAKAVVRTLLQHSTMATNPPSTIPEEEADGKSLAGVEEASGETADAAKFMRHWWPKLIDIAVGGREWDFVSR